MCVGPFAPKMPSPPPPPPLPPPLPPPPDPSDAATAGALSTARQRRRLQASLAQGRSSDIKTGGLGLATPAEGLKTALGG